MQSALYAIVCPSVCVSVSLSHGWLSQKRLKLGSCNFHHNGFPRAGASNKDGVGKTSYFLALCVDVLKTVPDTTKVTTNDW